MKKDLLTLLCLIASSIAFGQSVPNGGFENWTTYSHEDPQYYYNSNMDNNGGAPPYTVVKTSDAYSGSFALQLNTLLAGNDTLNAFIANGNPGAPAGQGIPYTEQATGISGQYKANIMPGDSALIWIIFKKSGGVIGNYMYRIGTSQASYTPFSFTFSPALPSAPDSMIFAMVSSNLTAFQGIPGQMFQVDSVAFTGVSSQPVNFNGDFELWTTNSSDKLNQWEISGNGSSKTPDKYSGNYALELQTIDNNGPQSSGATNGIGTQTGTIGGTPFSNQVDTLVFYYKFFPADANDSGKVTLNFKANAIIFAAESVLLKDTSSYRRVELPVNLGQVPDTVLIFINSTKNWASIPVSYIGGILKIDNMFFKSQIVPVTSFSAPAVGCVGQPVQLTDNSSNLPDAWSWNLTGGNPPSSTVQNPSVTYTATGTYTIGLTASNVNGSGSVVTQTINITNVPFVNPTSPDGPICESSGDTVLLIAYNTPGSTPVWMPGNLVGDSVYVTPNLTTTYSVVATDVNGCYSYTGTFTVTVLPQPAPAPTSSGSVCVGQTINLFSAAGGSNYNWTGPNAYASSQQNPSILNAQLVHSGIYTITMTGTNGCTKSDTVSVYVDGCTAVHAQTANVFSIYPNPSEGNFTLSMAASTGSAEVFDLTGTKVYSVELRSAATRLNLSHLADGIYFITVKTTEGTQRKKITKVN